MCTWQEVEAAEQGGQRGKGESPGKEKGKLLHIKALVAGGGMQSGEGKG